jgi:hypothetical protein
VVIDQKRPIGFEYRSGQGRRHIPHGSGEGYDRPSKNILMTMPKKRLISGMGRLTAQCGKKFFRFLTRYFKVKGIRAQINLVAPDEFTGRADSNLSKNMAIAPQSEYAFSDQIREVYRPENSVVKRQFQAIVFQGLDFGNFSHDRSSPRSLYGKRNKEIGLDDMDLVD